VQDVVNKSGDSLMMIDIRLTNVICKENVLISFD